MARRHRFHRIRRIDVEKKRFMERKKAAQQLLPWNVNAYYGGFNQAYDRALFKIVGRSSDGSGMMFGDGERDHGWSFKTYKEAREAANTLVDFPGITRVEIVGNLTEEREVVLMSGPFEPRYERRRRRRRRSKK